MDIIKKTILIEDFTSRDEKSYSAITGDTIYFNIFLSQNIEDIGVFTSIYFDGNLDVDNPPNYKILTNKLTNLGILFPFMSGGVPPTVTLSDDRQLYLRVSGKPDTGYYTSQIFTVTGITDNKLNTTQSYDNTNKYVVDFNLSDDQGKYYTGISSISVNSTGYTLSAIVDPSNPNKFIAGTGISYISNSDSTVPVIVNDDITNDVLLALFSFKGEGWNVNNITNKPIVKEEKYLGMVDLPEIDNDIFIDRGVTSVSETHLRLSDVRSVGHFDIYNNGFYNIIE